MRLRRRRAQADSADQQPRVDVDDVMHQLDDLVGRLRTETNRLEAANDRAGWLISNEEGR